MVTENCKAESKTAKLNTAKTISILKFLEYARLQIYTSNKILQL
jgi:hypothetical protein